MSKFNDSIKLSESLSFSNGKIIANDKSTRLIGVLDTIGYDELGRVIFTDSNTNEVTIAGSSFILEQMFKTPASNSRFLHPNSFPILYGNDNKITKPTLDINQWNNNTNGDTIDSAYIGNEKIFGFMIGVGGVDARSAITPKFEITSLQNYASTPSYIPFRIVPSSEADPTDDGVKYRLGITSNNKKYYFAKEFINTPEIKAEWSDGSGEVTNNDLSLYNVPISSYCKIVLNLSAADFREYFDGNPGYCYISQLGLVAGKPIYSGQNLVDYDDVRLVTCVNFKEFDFTNNKNWFRLTYKIYCL